jgi:glycosyltransferase involved in cell wall biosynthesis
MKVLVLTASLDDACYRYRIKAFLPAMARQGFETESLTLRRGYFGRAAQLLTMRRPDVVILQRKLMPLLHVGILRGVAPRLVYDLDDSLFEGRIAPYRGRGHRKAAIRFWATVRAADLVIVGNEHLRERTSRHIDLARICVIPTCVEPSQYALARHQRTGAAARLAWIGQWPTLQTLKLAEPYLAAVGRRLPGLELRLICDRAIELADLNVTFRPWSLATEACELADADIGISWLPDDSFSKGKCGLKVLQYMAAGLPVVGNPVGVTPNLVLHGRNGFLASSPEEWAEAIVRLASDPAMRRRMGTMGRRLVESEFSIGRWGDRFASLVGSVADSEYRAGEFPPADEPITLPFPVPNAEQRREAA